MTKCNPESLLAACLDYFAQASGVEALAFPDMFPNCDNPEQHPTLSGITYFTYLRLVDFGLSFNACDLCYRALELFANI